MFNVTLQSMASVRLTGGERDSLLLAFKNAKLSLVEYRYLLQKTIVLKTTFQFFSPEIHDLTTLSLHHFEDDEMLGGYVHNEWVPSVRVDPENR